MIPNRLKVPREVSLDTDTRQLSNFDLEPELNPLHNPLLAENLDRWAHVYAAAYPENRSQAIQQLLQDLQSEISATEPIGPALSHEISCSQCGKVKDPGQKFCGFCGAEFLPPTQKTERVPPFSSLKTDQSDPSSSHVSRDLDSLRELSFSTFYDSHESPRNGWRYTLAVLVILGCLGTIAYVQWRTQIRATWNKFVAPVVASNVAPSKPAPPPDNAPPPPAQATNTVQPDSENVSPSPQDQPAGAQQPAKNADDNQQTSAANPEQSVAAAPEKSAPAQTVTSAAKRDPIPSATTPALADNGSAELAVAQGYLNGTAGSRNSAQAATWLWKAVRKQNPTALVLLSDLYLHGDGVSKNCEQARLLLVAAARKDAPDASSKLRNFETSGCR